MQSLPRIRTRRGCDLALRRSAGRTAGGETGAVLVDRSHRAVITLTGGDRQTWLHSISTQHVSELPDGASTQNLSLDGQGRVEDHWIQTELGGTTYLDTEPWRGEPLLNYLRKMVFWAVVTPDTADLAVLSLVGPGRPISRCSTCWASMRYPANRLRSRWPAAASCAGRPANQPAKSNWTCSCRATSPPTGGTA